ncbi:sensor histidine kinase [Streptomyces sp. NPDC051561]|uniref:sensor histidine kinase n=1 Tax=Streptomyces sp. NPDC051561 TaxID=3365658 RepID=UPI003790172D
MSTHPTPEGPAGGTPTAPGPGMPPRGTDNVPFDAEGEQAFASIGVRPTSRRQILTKLLFVSVWLVFMSAPVTDLLTGRHTTPALVAGTLGLLAFIGVYLALVFRYNSSSPLARRATVVVLSTLSVLAAMLSLTLGPPWLVLFVYVAVSAGVSLPFAIARWIVPAATLLMCLIGLYEGGTVDSLTGSALAALLAGFTMTGVRHLIRTTIELREARATVAQLAANEERLRLARDLHDLLGHSLSLVTIKSELAGRMLPDHPEQAAQQVADIERVSRQALVDVREAVSGYRRATLPAELAGARTALAASGITAQVPARLPDDLADVPPRTEEALAWALREAVTNVVRHSGARNCTVRLRAAQTLDGPLVELTVQDDGRGTPAHSPGNGLTGMTERLAAVGGAVRTTAASPGFTLTATAPLGSAS